MAHELDPLIRSWRELLRTRYLPGTTDTDRPANRELRDLRLQQGASWQPLANAWMAAGMGTGGRGCRDRAGRVNGTQPEDGRRRHAAGPPPSTAA